MTRGKHATVATNRRLEGALEHIDRLVEQLADAKVRVRDAEARAARLEGIDKMWKDSEVRNDQLLADAMEKLKWWRRVAHEDHARRQAAWRELGEKLAFDLKLNLRGVDYIEFMHRRYPALFDALSAGRVEDRPWRPRWSRYRPVERKLSDDELKRFQRVMGERGVMQDNPDKDAAEVWAEAMEAMQAGFSNEEVMEYALGPDTTEVSE